METRHRAGGVFTGRNDFADDNPAIRILIEPPSDATFPASATLSSSAPRLYFDLPSAATATGPSKTISFPNAAAVPVLLSIFPDRDTI